MTQRLTVGTIAAVAVASFATLALAQSAGSTQETAEHRDWKTYEHRGEPSDICFATSQPKETDPAGVSRDTSYFYVSAWPKDGVKTEVSVKLGFDARADTPVEVRIGNSRFELFTKGDKAFVSDPNDELKLVNAMRRGSFMSVTATNAGGDTIRDTYSLLGVTAAIDAINDCK